MEPEDYIPRFLPGAYTHINAQYSVELDFARYKLIVEQGEFSEGESKSGSYLNIQRLTGGNALRRLYFDVLVDNWSKIAVTNSAGDLIGLVDKPFGVVWEYIPILYIDAQEFKEARRRKNKSEGFFEPE